MCLWLSEIFIWWSSDLEWLSWCSRLQAIDGTSVEMERTNCAAVNSVIFPHSLIFYWFIIFWTVRGQQPKGRFTSQSILYSVMSTTYKVKHPFTHTVDSHRFRVNIILHQYRLWEEAAILHFWLVLYPHSPAVKFGPSSKHEALRSNIWLHFTLSL